MAPGSPSFCTPVLPALPLLAASMGICLAGTERIGSVCVQPVGGVGAGVDAAIGVGFLWPGVAWRELGVLLMVA